jgi:putative Holliday junction resolvase
MKYIGIDYGTKKIGVAISDEGGSIAFPLTVIAAGREALSKITAIIRESGAGVAVVGESRNFSGQKNEVMEDIEAFVKDLQEQTHLPVHYEREFFTSAMAARQFAPEEKSRKQNPSQEKLDASAAALILQSYLDRSKRVE